MVFGWGVLMMRVIYISNKLKWKEKGKEGKEMHIHLPFSLQVMVISMTA